jgi:hypothetical protein
VISIALGRSKQRKLINTAYYIYFPWKAMIRTWRDKAVPDKANEQVMNHLCFHPSP